MALLLFHAGLQIAKPAAHCWSELLSPLSLGSYLVTVAYDGDTKTSTAKSLEANCQLLGAMLKRCPRSLLGEIDFSKPLGALDDRCFPLLLCARLHERLTHSQVIVSGLNGAGLRFLADELRGRWAGRGDKDQRFQKVVHGTLRIATTLIQTEARGQRGPPLAPASSILRWRRNCDRAAAL